MQTHSLSDPAEAADYVTPSNTVSLRGRTRGFWVGTTGSLVVRMRSAAVAFFSVPSGYFLPVVATMLLATSAAGLKAATATVASIVTLTSSDLIAGGVAELALGARQLTFTTAGGTPADAPATATITGTAQDGSALVETLALSQVAGVATTTGFFKTITSIVYPAADGTGATIAIGFLGTTATNVVALFE